MKYFLLISLLCETALAAGGYHEQGPITSLIIPALNFSVIFFGLIFLLRKPLKAAFDTKAQEVTQLYYHAEEKEKEARIKFDMYQEKMKNLEAEKTKVLNAAEQELKRFEQQADAELKQQMIKLEEESKTRVEYEKNLMIRELNESLLDEVIERARAKVKADQSLQSALTNKLSQEVRS